MAEALRVVIAAADDLIRQALALACVRHGVEVVGDSDTVEGMFVACVDGRPDVVVTGDRLGEEPLEAFLTPLLACAPAVIVVSDDPSPERLGSLLAQDVSGYFSYDAGPDEVVAGVVSVGRGGMVLNASVASTIIQQWRRMRAEPARLGPHRTVALTPRETDIVCAMAEGLAAKAIAARLGMALKTVENHKIRIFDKLGVRSQAHAVTVALTLGLAPSVYQQRDWEVQLDVDPV